MTTGAATKPWSVLLFTLCCALTGALGGCARTVDGAEGVGGETNWLQCGPSGECAQGFACRSGECVPMTSTGGPDGIDTPGSRLR